jgi:hypothetical protein
MSNIPKTNVPLTAHNSFANQLDFIIRSIMGELWTAMPVRVEAVEAPFVEILPLVNQIDNAGNPVDMAVIYGVPYFTLQGGGNAVIITPQKGDIGIAVFSMRDISGVKKAKGESAPETLRQYSPADAVYIGGLLNQPPERFIEIADDKITVKTDGKVVIDAANIELGADATDALILSSKLLQEFNTHTHAVTTTGTAAAQSGTTAAPTTPIIAADVTSKTVKTK